MDEREVECARRLEQLYHSALEHPEAERATFLATEMWRRFRPPLGTRIASRARQSRQFYRRAGPRSGRPHGRSATPPLGR
jgi:hypothetical protein